MSFLVVASFVTLVLSHCLVRSYRIKTMSSESDNKKSKGIGAHLCNKKDAKLVSPDEEQFQKVKCKVSEEEGEQA